MSSNPLLFLSSIAMLTGTKREASSCSDFDPVQSKNQREDDMATVMTGMSTSPTTETSTVVHNKPKGLFALKKQHHQHESKLKENLVSSQNAWSCAVPWSLFPTKVSESPYKSADVPSINPLVAAAASLESSSSSSSSSSTTGPGPNQTQSSMHDSQNNIRNVTISKIPPVLAGVGATVVVASSSTNPTMAGRLMTYLERSRSNLHGNGGLTVPCNEPHGQPTPQQGHGTTKLSIISPQSSHGFLMNRSRSSSGVSSVGSFPMGTSGSNSPTSECGTDNCSTSNESSTNLSTNLASNLSLNQGFLTNQGGAPPSSSSSSSSSTLVPPSSTLSSTSSAENGHNVVHNHIEPWSQSQPQPLGLQTTTTTATNGSSWPMSLNVRQGRERQPSNASIGSISRYSDGNGSLDGSHCNSTGESPADGGVGIPSLSISASLAQAVSTIPHSGLNSPVTTNNNPQLLQSIQQMRLRRLQHQQSTTMNVNNNLPSQNQGMVIGPGLGQGLGQNVSHTTDIMTTVNNNDNVTTAALSLAGMRTARVAHVQPMLHDGMQGPGGAQPIIELRQIVTSGSSNNRFIFMESTSSSSSLPLSSPPEQPSQPSQPQESQEQEGTKDEQSSMVIVDEEINLPPPLLLPQPMTTTTVELPVNNHHNRTTFHRAI